MELIMQKWEYKVVSLSSMSTVVDEHLKQLNELGLEGWEAITALSGIGLLLKRPKA